jgi:hypothetical protein
MKMAKADTGGKRLRIDYVLLSGTNALDLQGDTTYFVTNTVNVSGTLTIEGGTVVKYINNGLAEIIATNIVCLSSNYAPGVFTSMNDNSVGATITNSTGTPTQSTNFFLYFGGLGTNSLVFRNLRFSYGGECISGIINVSGTNSIDIWDCQFFNCDYGFMGIVTASPSGGFPINVYNTLFSQCGGGVYGSGSGSTFLNVSLVNVTGDAGGSVISGVGNNVCNATNSLFTEMVSMAGITLSSTCGVYSSGNNVYQTVGAAGYYLVKSSTNRTSGTSTGLSAALLADLAARTTYPPLTLTDTLTNSTNLTIQAPRNTGAPDIGYHYCPLDWVLNLWVSNNSPITITAGPGVSVGTYATSSQTYGIYLFINAILNWLGTATSPNYLTPYNIVQEQSTANWCATVGPATLYFHGGSNYFLNSTGYISQNAAYYFLLVPPVTNLTLASDSATSLATLSSTNVPSNFGLSMISFDGPASGIVVSNLFFTNSHGLSNSTVTNVGSEGLYFGENYATMQNGTMQDITVTGCAFAGWSAGTMFYNGLNCSISSNTFLYAMGRDSGDTGATVPNCGVVLGPSSTVNADFE